MSVSLLITFRDRNLDGMSMTSAVLEFDYEPQALAAKEGIERQYAGSGIMVRITVVRGTS